jgi:Spy/CpxP family protein refolding chaperone
MVTQLQLSNQQVDQLRGLDFAHREKHQALKAQLDGLRLQLDKAFTDDNVDKASVRQTAQKIAEVKGGMFVERIDSRLAFENILTAEQIDRLKQYPMGSKMKGKQQGQRQMKGRHWAQNRDCGRFLDNSVE